VTTWTVGTGGSFNFSTIQAAVNAAGNGDTIEIAAGTYREQVTVSGKDITIHGAGAGQTIIEAPTRHRWLPMPSIRTPAGRTSSPLSPSPTMPM
jgi:pectin methylesterase-like acyl-CoA thioesterase